MSTPRMVGLRFYLCTSGALSAYGVFVGSADVFASGDFAARLSALLILLTVCGIIALDTLINDVLGDRWQLEWIESWRHDAFVVLALVNLALIFVAAGRQAESTYLVRLALDAAFSVYVAVRDVQIRFMKPREESHTHADHRA